MTTYVKKSGKQSVITIILALCLIIALVSLPLKFLLLNNTKDTVKKMEAAGDQ